MLRILGPTHEKTLEAKDNLANLYGFQGEQHLPLALQMSEEVMQIRAEKLGREYHSTLKSLLTVAKIKAALNRFDEAEQIFQQGLPAAMRNCGENHLGTLAARTWLRHLYWRRGIYPEADKTWEDIIQKHKYKQAQRSDGEHIDRVQAMWFLVHSYEDQGRINDAMKLCEETTELVEKFGGQGLGPRHKIWVQLRSKREALARA